ncbi:MAG: PEP/pyruvate-binding domain-containing protein, partial [Casimicrobiaceae bacterium]
MERTQAIGWFGEVGLADRPLVGGKGGSLGELTRADIAVPPGFVVATPAFDAFIAELEAHQPVRATIEALDSTDLASLTQVTSAIRERIEREPLPAALREAIGVAHARLCAGAATPVAIRSSATTEDAEDASFAGLQDTYLWVTSLEDALTRIRSCWASLYSVESVGYRRRRAVPEAGVSMAVVVQRMVDARTAGVMFTRSPLTGDRSVMTIEGAWGLGSAVVGGEVTPDRWVVGKITGEITVRDVSDKQIEHRPRAGGGVESLPTPPERSSEPCLNDDELQALRAVGRRVEKHYGRPQDIEWAFEHGTNALLLLQSRPETVWSAREAAPVATAAADPRSHVMSIFGGRK